MRVGANWTVVLGVSRGLVSFNFAYASPKHSGTGYSPFQVTGYYTLTRLPPLVGDDKFWTNFVATASDTVVRAGGSSIRSSQHL